MREFPKNSKNLSGSSDEFSGGKQKVTPRIEINGTPPGTALEDKEVGKFEKSENQKFRILENRRRGGRREFGRKNGGQKRGGPTTREQRQFHWIRKSNYLGELEG